MWKFFPKGPGFSWKEYNVWGKFIDMRFSTESISSNKVVALTVHVD